jgi:hypothetical protein
MNDNTPQKPAPPQQIPQCIGRVMIALAEPPARPKPYSQLLDETGLPRWKLNAALDEMIRRGIAQSGYPEEDSVREFYWLVWDPPGYPYWLDDLDDDDDDEKVSFVDEEQEVPEEGDDTGSP